MRATPLLLASVLLLPSAPDGAAAELRHPRHHRVEPHLIHRFEGRMPHRHGPLVRRPHPHAAAAIAAGAAAAGAAAAVATQAARPAPPPAPVATGSVTGLRIPRFASLRADVVNLRAGPGTQYPIQWVYKKTGLPVEIEREYDVWRLVQDHDGTKGWIHEATLIGTRSFMVQAPAATPGATDTNGLADTVALRARSDDGAAAVAYLKPGVVGRIAACAAGSDWCRVTVHGYGGWLRRDQLWGVEPGEVVGGS